MPQTKRTPAGTALTDLILDLFRVNSLILTAGDRLVAPLGLTSARWQIVGAIVAGGITGLGGLVITWLLILDSHLKHYILTSISNSKFRFALMPWN